MPNWRDFPRNKPGSSTPSWLEILTKEPPPTPRANLRNTSLSEVVPQMPEAKAPGTVKIPPKAKKAPPVVKVPQVKIVPPTDVVEGVYEPIFIFCDDCGRTMFRQLDDWHCWCGRVVENFAAEHHVKS